MDAARRDEMPAQSEADAVKAVDKHVEPKKCMVWYADNKTGWTPIPGTGCAHWVSHQKGWNSGKESSNGCKLKFLFRVKDVVSKSGGKVDAADVAVGNVWASADRGHCGIVSKVTKAKAAADPPTIEIESCSSRQGKVAKNDWAGYYKSGGDFFAG
jgi:hypothetical protein